MSEQVIAARAVIRDIAYRPNIACSQCGRGLNDEASRKRGMGVACARRFEREYPPLD